MLGAAAYLRDPAVPREYTAAVVGLERVNLRGVTEDVAALGSEWSSLGEVFSRAAQAEHLQVTTHPHGESGGFYQSDVMAFAESGIPSFLLQTGDSFSGRSPDWGDREVQRYLRTRYHQPSDEFRSDFRWEGVLQQVRTVIRVAWDLAGSPEFPTWESSAAYRAVGERLRVLRLRGGGP